MTDLAGTNASAKAKWTARFGRPQKQRPRPAVVEALRRALLSIAGRAFEGPAALDLFLRREDVERRLATKRR